MMLMNYESFLSVTARQIGELAGKSEELSQRMEGITPAQMKQATRLMRERKVTELHRQQLVDLMNNITPSKEILLSQDSIITMINAGIVL